MKLATDTWKQRGSISLWRYTENERNYPGWHLSADRAGCQAMAELLDAFVAENVPMMGTITLDPPTARVLSVPSNKGGAAAFVSPAKLRLRYIETPGTWQLSEASDVVELVVGSDWIAPLRKGCNDMPAGRGDYSIGASPELWFWWRLDT